jgi:hypothetical protein
MFSVSNDFYIVLRTKSESMIPKFDVQYIVNL